MYVHQKENERTKTRNAAIGSACQCKDSRAKPIAVDYGCPIDPNLKASNRSDPARLLRVLGAGVKTAQPADHGRRGVLFRTDVTIGGSCSGCRLKRLSPQALSAASIRYVLVTFGALASTTCNIACCGAWSPTSRTAAR
jgi:hypothetical protein